MKKNNFLIFPLMALFVCSCSQKNAEPNEPAGILVYDDFETGELNWQTQTSRAGNILLTDTVSARAGNRVLQVEVFQSDPWVENGPRTELFSPEGINEFWKEGDEIWIGGSIFFDTDYADDPMQEIIWQIHGDATDSYVPFLIQSINNQLVIKGNGILQKAVPKQKGQWTDIVVHHKWSSEEKGVTQVYINGTTVSDEKNISNMKPNTSLYWKFGIYKSGWKNGGDSASTVTHRKLWFDEIRIGDSRSNYEAVAPK